MGVEDRIANNLAAVKARIASACDRAGRSVDEVRLVAVTKTVGVAEIRALHQLGQRDFGENRVIPAGEKAEALTALDLRWHFIGHLQRNKAARVLPHFLHLHSLESQKLAEVLNRQLTDAGLTLNAFVEVNVSGEESKYGLHPDGVAPFLKTCAALPQIKPVGLMTMAPYEAEREATRPVFCKLRELRDQLAEQTGIVLPELSMGMSNDFEVAIEEGATVVRVGSLLFA